MEAAQAVQAARAEARVDHAASHQAARGAQPAQGAQPEQLCSHTQAWSAQLCSHALKFFLLHFMSTHWPVQSPKMLGGGGRGNAIFLLEKGDLSALGPANLRWQVVVFWFHVCCFFPTRDRAAKGVDSSRFETKESDAAVRHALRGPGMGPAFCSSVSFVDLEGGSEVMFFEGAGFEEAQKAHWSEEQLSLSHTGKSSKVGFVFLLRFGSTKSVVLFSFA